MRIPAQRVTEASVTLDGRLTASVGKGLPTLLASGREDGPGFHRNPVFAGMAQKLIGLRIFPGKGAQAGKLHTSIHEFGGEILLVPQFTLYADCRKGHGPSFSEAGEPCRAGKDVCALCRTC